MFNFKTKQADRHSALKAHVSKKISEFENLAEVDIGFAARNNTSPVPILAALCANFRSLKSKVESELYPKIKDLESQIQGLPNKRIKARNQEHIDEINQGLENVILDLERGYVKGKFGSHKLRRISGAICIFVDAFFCASALQVITENLLFALIISVGIAGLLFFLINSVSKKVKNAKTKNEGLSWSIGLFVIAIIIFGSLSVIRYEYYSAGNPQLTSPIILVVLSMVFFIAAFVLAFDDTKKDLDEIDNSIIRRKKDEERKLELRKEILNEEMEYSDFQLHEINRQLQHTNVVAEKLLDHTESECNRVCLQCISTYKLKGGAMSIEEILNELKNYKK